MQGVKPLFATAAALTMALLAVPSVSAWDLPGGVEPSEILKSPLVPGLEGIGGGGGGEGPCEPVVTSTNDPFVNVNQDCLPMSEPEPSPSPQPEPEDSVAPESTEPSPADGGT